MSPITLYGAVFILKNPTYSRNCMYTSIIYGAIRVVSKFEPSFLELDRVQHTSHHHVVLSSTILEIFLPFQRNEHQ